MQKILKLKHEKTVQQIQKKIDKTGKYNDIINKKYVNYTLEKKDPHNSGALYHLVAT